MRRAVIIGGLLGALTIATGTAAADTAQSPRVDVAAAKAGNTQIARVLVPTRATARPGAGATRMKLRPNGGYAGGATQLRVLATAMSGGDQYLKVSLPRRPNGSAGWIRADHTRTHTTKWSVRVNTRTKMIEVRRGAKVIKRSKVVVGKASTPTPRGRFAVSEIVRQPSARGFYGPWVLTLTAFSDVLERFQGGPGLVAIHGRAGASLRDPLGSARSHGCVRIPNGLVSWMAANLEPGVPVDIR